MPKIITGKIKGLKLNCPPGQHTRPTGARVKESVFNIISAHVAGSSFLDLFAGCGQIGMEALSRGAKRAVFVDRDPKSTASIKGNLTKARMLDETRVFRMNAFEFLRADKELAGKFDVLYMDPPFDFTAKRILKLLEAVADSDLLDDDPLIILEHDSALSPPENVINLKLARSCKYGAIMISFYERIGRVEGPL